jgi:hypothetical protein
MRGFKFIVYSIHLSKVKKVSKKVRSQVEGQVVDGHEGGQVGG